MRGSTVSSTMSALRVLARRAAFEQDIIARQQTNAGKSESVNIVATLPNFVSLCPWPLRVFTTPAQTLFAGVNALHPTPAPTQRSDVAADPVVDSLSIVQCYRNPAVFHWYLPWFWSSGLVTGFFSHQLVKQFIDHFVWLTVFFLSGNIS